MIADEPSGRVFGRAAPLVSYRLAKADERRLAIAVEAMTRVMLAAGASEVELGGGAPRGALRSRAGRGDERLDVRRLRLAGFHPTGTAAAGSDPPVTRSIPRAGCAASTGVWVADGSILPSCPGVNPQVSIMAMARASARRRRPRRAQA